MRSSLPMDIMRFSLMNLPQEGVLFVIFSHIDYCIVVAQNLDVKNNVYLLSGLCHTLLRITYVFLIFVLINQKNSRKDYSENILFKYVI